MRFSLRAMLVCTTAIAIISPVVISRSDMQRKTIARIDKLGGLVSYDDEVMPFDTDDVDFTANQTHSLGTFRTRRRRFGFRVPITTKNYELNLAAYRR